MVHIPFLNHLSRYAVLQDTFRFCGVEHNASPVDVRGIARIIKADSPDRKADSQDRISRSKQSSDAALIEESHDEETLPVPVPKEKHDAKKILNDFKQARYGNWKPEAFKPPEKITLDDVPAILKNIHKTQALRKTLSYKLQKIERDLKVDPGNEHFKNLKIVYKAMIHHLDQDPRVQDDGRALKRLCESVPGYERIKLRENIRAWLRNLYELGNSHRLVGALLFSPILLVKIALFVLIIDKGENLLNSIFNDGSDSGQPQHRRQKAAQPTFANQPQQTAVPNTVSTYGPVASGPTISPLPYPSPQPSFGVPPASVAYQPAAMPVSYGQGLVPLQMTPQVAQVPVPGYLPAYGLPPSAPLPPPTVAMTPYGMVPAQPPASSQFLPYLT